MQPCREALKLVEIPKLEFLEGHEEVKGILLLLGEALNLIRDGGEEVKVQAG